MDIGARIKQLRKDKFTAKELADIVGVTREHLSAVENNIKPISLPTLEKICDAIGISLSDFFNEKNSAINLTPELKELLDNAKQLPPDKIDYLNWFIEGFALGKKHVLVELAPGESYTYDAEKKPPTKEDVKRFDELYEEFKEIARKDPVQRKKFEDMGLRFYFDEK